MFLIFPVYKTPSPKSLKWDRLLIQWWSQLWLFKSSKYITMSLDFNCSGVQAKRKLHDCIWKLYFYQDIIFLVEYMARAISIFGYRYSWLVIWFDRRIFVFKKDDDYYFEKVALRKRNCASSRLISFSSNFLSYSTLL